MKKMERGSIERSPILLTGGNRTGTTWAGKMLAASEAVGYIPEAFNTEVGLLRNSGLIKQEYLHLPQCDEFPDIYNLVSGILDWRYYSVNDLFLATEYQPFRWNYARRIKHYYMMLRNRMQNRRGLLKDPIALFSAEWLADKFNMQVVVLIRHPAAYVASIKRVGWRFDFNNLSSQERLMDDLLFELRDEIYHPPSDIVSEASLLWKCFYHAVEKYKQRRPDWIFVLHEELSKDPVAGFKDLYNRLHIPLGEKEYKVIREHSYSLSQTDVASDVVHQLKRDSSSLVNAWKSKLSESELRDIKAKTAPVWMSFYDEDTWYI